VELGLTGRKALVCASSRGLGRACATSLAREGVQVVVNGRDHESLEETAATIRRETGAKVTAVVADLCVARDRERLLAGCPAEWLAALEANLLAPALMIRSLIGGMRERRFGRIVNITSAMVKTPLAPMGLSTAARSGLTALCKALSRDAVRDNVTINNLLPERIDTERQVQMAKLVAGLRKISYEEARAEQTASIAAGRLGRPEEVGDACAFLCSAQAGFISGQNLQLDGGSYAGVL
jgi:3-oxoacyl-[acyl-carrier protein] reductase